MFKISNINLKLYIQNKQPPAYPYLIMNEKSIHKITKESSLLMTTLITGKSCRLHLEQQTTKEYSYYRNIAKVLLSPL